MMAFKVVHLSFRLCEGSIATKIFSYNDASNFLKHCPLSSSERLKPLVPGWNPGTGFREI